MRWLFPLLLLVGCGARLSLDGWHHAREEACLREGENGGRDQDGYGCRTGKGVLAGLTWPVR